MATRPAEKAIPAKKPRRKTTDAAAEPSLGTAAPAAAARKTAPRPARPPAVAAQAANPTGGAAARPDPKSLLQAGLKAIGEVHDGVVQRQTRVVETLLGIQSPTRSDARQASKAADGSRSALDSLGDSLGFRKLEDVFDQRIAAALKRLGVPSAQEFEALRLQVEALMQDKSAEPAPASRPRPRKR